MSDYLSHLVERSLSATASVRPQVISIFEPPAVNEGEFFRSEATLEPPVVGHETETSSSAARVSQLQSLWRASPEPTHVAPFTWESRAAFPDAAELRGAQRQAPLRLEPLEPPLGRGDNKFASEMVQVDTLDSLVAQAPPAQSPESSNPIAPPKPMAQIAPVELTGEEGAKNADSRQRPTLSRSAEPTHTNEQSIGSIHAEREAQPSRRKPIAVVLPPSHESTEKHVEAQPIAIVEGVISATNSRSRDAHCVRLWNANLSQSRQCETPSNTLIEIGGQYHHRLHPSCPLRSQPRQLFCRPRLSTNI